MALLLYPELLETRTYPFQRLRYMHEHTGLQEGVYAAADYDVVQRAAGANMSVDVGAGSAWVRGDTGTRQGFYHVVNDATVNLSVTAAHATLPRVDQVILRVFDSTVSGGSDVPTLSVLAGTATSGATLDNRTGAAALPNDAIRLADILVAAADTSITNSEIRDRRPWVRGAHRLLTRNTNAAAGNDYTTSSTTAAIIDATNLQPRIECSGAPVEVVFRGIAQSSSNHLIYELRMDGALIDGGQMYQVSFVGAGVNQGFEARWRFIPAAGSHLFAPYHRMTGAGTGTTVVRAANPIQLVVREDVLQDVSND